MKEKKSEVIFFVFWMLNSPEFLKTARQLSMGLLDTSVQESHSDRHDHNSVVEGNVVRISDHDSRFVMIVVLVIVVCLSLAYAIKIAVGKCIDKLIKAMRREAVISTV